jgi:hypothetical protein
MLMKKSTIQVWEQIQHRKIRWMRMKYDRMENEIKE